MFHACSGAGDARGSAQDRTDVWGAPRSTVLEWCEQCGDARSPREREGGLGLNTPSSQDTPGHSTLLTPAHPRATPQDRGEPQSVPAALSRGLDQGTTSHTVSRGVRGAAAVAGGGRASGGDAAHGTYRFVAPDAPQILVRTQSDQSRANLKNRGLNLSETESERVFSRERKRQKSTKIRLSFYGLRFNGRRHCRQRRRFFDSSDFSL